MYEDVNSNEQFSGYIHIFLPQGRFHKEIGLILLVLRVIQNLKSSGNKILFSSNIGV